MTKDLEQIVERIGQLPDGERKILIHTLGADKPKVDGDFYRNRFVTGEGSADFDMCESLVGKGVFAVRRNIEMFGGSDMYWATDLGKNLAQQTLDEIGGNK